ELRDELSRLREELETVTAPPVRRPEVFRFGLGEKTPTFDKADWKGLSNNMIELSKLILDIFDPITKGQDPSPTAIKKVQKYNMPLAIFAVKAAEEIEGTGPNGSFTHPAVVANLIRAALVNAGDPLSETQEISLRALGDAWAAEMEREASRFNEKTLALEKAVFEVDAKLRFLYSVKNTLTPSQREFLFTPATEGRVQMDLLSPALVYVMRRPLAGDSREDLEKQLEKTIVGILDLGEGDTATVEWVARQWLDDYPASLQAVEKTSLDFICPHVDRIQEAARAEIAAIKRLIDQGNFEEDKIQTLREETTVLMPQLIRPSGGSGEENGGGEEK
ncbi:MAG: hypothetical protein ACYS47_13210, partial [Planctomycetota bacterium]